MLLTRFRLGKIHTHWARSEKMRMVVVLEVPHWLRQVTSYCAPYTHSPPFLLAQ